ncbi:YitT family protein [Bacillus sp. NEB1478]|uniref:YitT family protein n=1 Tax=Bacillus sp. NEB1478 TaxID=3073816 RepID=UPI002873281E|nr:YitT family protein [Bacillus sp. NEB1478]WNB90312.1 YitT family protein [Bacillus sp. NEB1478]
MNTKIQKSLAILAGLFLTAAGMKILNIHSLTFGGTAGIATLGSFLSNWSWGILFLIVNLPFFILSIRKLGWTFSISTFLCILLVSAITDLLTYIHFPTVTPIFASLFAGTLIGVGVSLVLNSGASLGGIHILALYLEQKSNINRGLTLFVTDFMIVSSAIVIVGFNNAFISIFSISIASFIVGKLKAKSPAIEYEVDESIDAVRNN